MNNTKLTKIMYGEEMTPIWFYENDNYVIMEWMSDSITEDTLFKIVKAAHIFFDKDVYPRSGKDPFSWNGILTIDHCMDLKMMDY